MPNATEANRNLRVFVDANVLIRGITLPRFPYEILQLSARKALILVVSPSVLADVRYYLSRLFPDHLAKFEAYLATAAVEITPDASKEAVWAHQNLVRDIKDVPVVLAAAGANVDYLVSTDTDLTDRDESTEALRQFLHPAQVLRVGQFLHEVMGWDHAALNEISKRQWWDL